MQPTDQPQQETTSPTRMYEVRLFQVAEVHTETFSMEAADEADATGKANEILATKNLEGVQHRIEVLDVTPEQETETPESPAPEAADSAPIDYGSLTNGDTAGPGPVPTGSLAPLQNNEQAPIQENAAAPSPGNDVTQSGQIVQNPGA